VVVPCVGVPLSDPHVPLQTEVGLEEPWLGCDVEPTKTQHILLSRSGPRNTKIMALKAMLSAR